jgi:hypothetical protein
MVPTFMADIRDTGGTAERQSIIAEQALLSQNTEQQHVVICPGTMTVQDPAPPMPMASVTPSHSVHLKKYLHHDQKKHHTCT